jgi:hypothetical protein
MVAAQVRRISRVTVASDGDIVLQLLESAGKLPNIFHLAGQPTGVEVTHR